MNLRDVPDEVYAALVEAAEANRQSLSAIVVDRLTEVAQVARLEDYVASYQPPQGSGLTLDDAAYVALAERLNGPLATASSLQAPVPAAPLTSSPDPQTAQISSQAATASSKMNVCSRSGSIS